MSQGLQQLRAALDRKQRGVTAAAPTPKPPAEIRYATEGTHIARDGKPYTITYDKEKLQ